MYAYVYNEPLNRNDPTGQEGVGCWNNGKECGGDMDIAQTTQPLEGVEAKVGPVLEGVEEAADLAGKTAEAAQVGAATEGAATDASNLARHRVIGTSLRMLGRASTAGDVVEAGSQVLQGDIKGAAATGINASIGPIVFYSALALGAYPPVAIGAAALGALGADVGGLGESIISPEGTLTPAQQQMNRELRDF